MQKTIFSILNLFGPLYMRQKLSKFKVVCASTKKRAKHVSVMQVSKSEDNIQIDVLGQLKGVSAGA